MGSVQETHEEDKEMPEAESDDSMRHGLTTLSSTWNLNESDALVTQYLLFKTLQTSTR
jgi:hypothetical protein